MVPEVPTTRYNTSHFGRWKSPYQGLDVFRMQDDIICCVWETGIRPLQNYLLFLSRFRAVPIGFELKIVTARPSKVPRMCYFTTLTELLVLVMAHSCYLEPQTKKEVRAKGQRKKTARV